MNRKVREPFVVTRALNMVLGIIILVLVIAAVVLDGDTTAFEIWIFALAAVENFIAATVSFSEQKKVRGNVYAILCAVFLIIALILAVSFFGII